MYITRCFTGLDLDFDRFEAEFISVSLWLVIVALPIALFYVSEALRRIPQSHQRRSVLNLKF